jgi:uncharacterized linocin/CFP29 family protein
MDDRDAQVGWTEAQWNRVREEVLRAWERVRVAGSFLPVYGPLPPSTQVVPSEIFRSDGTVDDQATAVLLEISLPVKLTRQEVREGDLPSALLQFRRRAAQVGQLEDWFIFNGIYPSVELSNIGRAAFAEDAKAELPSYLPDFPYVQELIHTGWAPVSGGPRPIAGQGMQRLGMRQRNPGALGLVEGPRVEEEARQGEDAETEVQRLDDKGLMRAIVGAINLLEQRGYVAPYVCVFGRRPFQAAHDSIDNSTVLPRDRLEPLIGRELLHASAIDVLPFESDRYAQLDKEAWPSRGVLLSMADEAIDLAIAAEAAPEFRQVDEHGRFVFSVFERFVLRIKDPKAIVPLMFEGAGDGGAAGAGDEGPPDEGPPDEWAPDEAPASSTDS